MLKTATYTRRAIDAWRLANRDKFMEQSRQSAKRYYHKVAEYKAVIRQFRNIDPTFFD